MKHNKEAREKQSRNAQLRAQGQPLPDLEWDRELTEVAEYPQVGISIALHFGSLIYTLITLYHTSFN